MRDVFFHLPNTIPSPPSTKLHHPNTLTLLYFIPGNPGLIEYYTPFLTLLAKKSETWTDKGKSFGVAGVSLGGFEASTTIPSNVSSGSTGSITERRGTDGKEGELLPLYPSSFPQKQTATYTLRDQIDLSYARITTLVNNLRRRGPDTPGSIEVILVGHSVGAYIALELLSLHHQHQYSHSHSHSPQPQPSPSSKSPQTYTITHTHLLTPTIINISHSPSGLIATPLLTYLPFLPLLLQLSSRTLTSALPNAWVKTLVRRVTGMKNEEMVDVTTRFLGRAGAVRQALEMAGCEMMEIGEGSWVEAVWGGSGGGGEDGDGDVDTHIQNGEEGDASRHTSRENKDAVATQWKPPIHHFLFAKEDHWVADETREAIIKSMNGRAKILVDNGELGLVHAWCLEQSEMVAGIVSGWIEETLFGDE